MGETTQSGLSDALKKAGVNTTVKLITFPVEKNKILARVENLVDEGAAAQVDLKAVGEALWQRANVRYPRTLDDVVVTELSLTGNMKISEKNGRKI